MARPTKTQQLSDLHQSAIAEFDTVQSALRDERMQCLQDRRFYSLAGAAWEGPVGELYENRPRMEFNKIHLAVIRIINEYRNNRITVDFISKEGEEYDSLADTCDDLFRADCQDSCAEEAFDNAFEEAVGGGYGAFRLTTGYENEEDDDDDKQRIRVVPICDADSSVYFSLNAKRQDKSDAKRCWVITAMTRDAYKEEWDDDPATWPKDVQQTEFDWSTPDVVYVAEFYQVEEERETVRVFKKLDGDEEKYTDSELEDDESILETLAATGAKEVRSKKVKRRKVHKYIMSGSKILEDCGYIAGTEIPIVPVYGKRWFVDNVERCMGHVRLAKDAQRLKNMQMSKLAEISALSSVSKPILTPEQIAGHQVMWQEDNIKDYPYLLVNPVTDANGNTTASGPVAYTKSPEIPPAMAALLQLTEQDMRDILGNQQQGDKIVSNISAEAVDLVQNRLDMQTFIYMSNMAKAMKRCGQIWLSMAKDVYVEEGRKMKGIGAQGEMRGIELMRPIANQETGETELENDLANAKFDIYADVGPSSSSKRQSTVKTLSNMLTIAQTDPEDSTILRSMIMMNLEGEGVQDVREYYRKKMVRMGVHKPTEQDIAEMQAQGNKPDPQSQYMLAESERAKAEASDFRANTLKNISQADLNKAKEAETLAKIDQGERDQIIKTLETINKVRPQGGSAGA
jgi:hypothetical protein